MKVLFLSPEVVPFAKTGGLADVAGALPGALKRLAVDVRLVLPLYRMVREGGFESRPLLKDVEVPLGSFGLKAVILETKVDDGVPIYLVEREDMYDRPNLYGDAMGDYYDNLERFTFFARAALRVAESIDFRPNLIHCHDWQTGLVPALLQAPPKQAPFFRGIPTVFTIHNLGYQGLFLEEKLPVTGLSREAFFRPEGLEYWGKISLLKAGIVYSQAITTVSPTYAREIQTSEFGLGMEGILRHRKASLHGILNGADYRTWDPSRDEHLPQRYSVKKVEGKHQCKKDLMREMGLDLSLRDRPLFGMVSRLDKQKGLDLLVEILEDILSMDVGLVILGSGEEQIQESLQQAAVRHPKRIGLKLGFDEALAHRIMAGADIFLIPSRYEPCGLTQMYALKYGTVPVVRATGGLEDTIVTFDPRRGTGNGFKFRDYDPDAFLGAIRKAVEYFQDSKRWEKVVTNAMGADFSWDRSARAYLDLYKSLLRR
ncbi:MAG: glycogen synthase GlgA [Proteobacteria bacterium]|nr:glycogen synthase GlgA [Pseudomonadota bacterium]NIS69488.1 glycogen synthase GlgA [Pseudomonadota bacterium]